MKRDDTISQLLEEAKTTQDQKRLKKLAKCESMIVRRAVARNPHAPSSALQELAFDPIANVSYMATNHQNCSVEREFASQLPVCVTCKVDERKLDCETCKQQKAS